MTDVRGIFAGVVLTLAVPAAVFAQKPPTDTAPVSPRTERLDPTKCAPSDTPSTTGKGAPAEEGKSESDNLSHKLARSDGVICPPPTADSEIKAPTPPGGAMKVIPPPGTPGGDQNVQPK